MKERLALLQDSKGVLKIIGRNLTAKYLLVIKPRNMLEEESIRTHVDAIKSYVEEKLQVTEDQMNDSFKDQMFETRVIENN